MKDIIQGIKNKTTQLTSNPGIVFGTLYPYVLIMGLLLGIFYVKNLENISRQSVPPALVDSTIVTDLPQKNSVIVPPIKISEVKNSTPELLAEGEKLFKANCASCHGENGTGGGPAAMGLNPAPRNFTSKDNWVNGTKLSQIYTTLQEGLPPSAMASYDYLLPKEKFALAHYIRTNFIPDPAKDTDDDLLALDATYNLSGGLEIPAQIPVVKATSIIITENENEVSEVNQILKSLSDYKTENGYGIFNQTVNNQKVAVTFLVRNQNWKQSENNFVNLVVNNVNQNGFNGNIFNLQNNEWTSLYNFMIRII